MSVYNIRMETPNFKFMKLIIKIMHFLMLKNKKAMEGSEFNERV